MRMLIDPNVNIASYSNRHEVARLTARKDINELLKKGLIVEEKLGRDIMINISSKKVIEEYANL